MGIYDDNITEIKRPHLINSYKDTMKKYLTKRFGIDNEELLDGFIKDMIQKNIKRPKVHNVISPKCGDMELKSEDLWNFVNKNKSQVITPFGTIYKPTHVEKSFISEMIGDKLAARSATKKEMFAAAAVGDSVTEKRKNNEQSAIKIRVNSLPGGMGSEYNCFYDLPGYNAVTATSRALIKQSYVTTEQTLCGNFYWYDEQQVINYILVNLKHCPDSETIYAMVDKYNLFTPNALDVYDEFMTSAINYNPHPNYWKVRSILEKIRGHELVYIYYLNNLKLLFFKNETFFKEWVKDLCDIDKVPDYEDVGPDYLFKLDDEIIPMLSINFDKLLNGKKLFELPKEHPELSTKLSKVGRYMSEKIASIDELLETLFYSKTICPNGNKSHNMLRKSVILSDTDSVLFTTKDWVQWYTGDVMEYSPDVNKISSVAIYFLTKSIAHVMYKFSVTIGATGSAVRDMVMKNEFFYPSMLVFDKKKTYTGLISIREGVILPEPKLDLKGGTLRSSSLPYESMAYIKEFTVDKILTPAISGKISARQLISNVIDREFEIMESLAAGATDFMGISSIKTISNYKNPMSSTYFYSMGWNEIFADKYGDIKLPTKAPILTILDVNKKYLEWLRDQDKVLYANFTKFHDEYGKYPSKFAINPQEGKIPKELMPLVDVRSIVYANLSPVYDILGELVPLGFKKRKMLVSDVYPFN